MKFKESDLPSTLNSQITNCKNSDSYTVESSIEFSRIIAYLLTITFLVGIGFFKQRLQILNHHTKEIISLVIVSSQIYFISECNYQEHKNLLTFVISYGSIAFSSCIVFFECVPNLLRALIYQTLILLYLFLSFHFRCRAECNNFISISFNLKEEISFLLFTYFISIANSFYLFKLRYSYSIDTYSQRKTLKNWKKLMNLCDFGISIETSKIKYRNQKYEQYLCNLSHDTQYKGKTTQQVTSFQPNIENTNYLITQNSIYFDSERSQLYIAKDAPKSAESEKELQMATIIHELRTPLNIIMAILESFTDCPQIKKDSISKALCAASMQEALINDILDVAKINNNEFILNNQPTEILPVVMSIYDMFKFKIPSTVDFKVSVDGVVPRIVLIDERRYRQIVLNLLSNACKFTSTGEIVLWIRYESNTLYTGVKDSGIGIEECNYGKIFKQFGKIEDANNKSGTGLGLNLCKILSQKMLGDITFTSTYGVGTEFKFFIYASESPKLLNSILTIHDCKKIIIVDDNVMNLEIIKSFAYKAKIECIAFNDSEQAKKALAHEINEFVGLFDLNMPKINGYELASSIRQNNYRCKLIAFSGEDKQRIYELCMQNGFDGILEKPVSFRKFCECLNLTIY